MNTFMKKALVGLTLALTCAGLSTSAFAGILQQPTLVIPNNVHQMEVTWQDDGTQVDTLKYGKNTSYTGGTIAVPEYGSSNQHSYTICGLTPNTKYYYEVIVSGVNYTGTFTAGLYAPGTNFGANILKQPYLIYPNNVHQMEVLWQDTATQVDTLKYGKTTSYTETIAVPEYGNFNQHKYTICGLIPDTRYYYEVMVNGVPYSGSFITAPAANAKNIRFIGMGDSRSNPFYLDNLMQAMKTFYSQPGNADYQRFVIHNGDWVSTDGESYWTSQWFDPTKTDIVSFVANSPIDGVKGNHDNASGYSATFPKYYPFPYPAATAKTVAPTNDTTGNPYYNNLYWSFDYGPVHFTCVDEYSDFSSTSAQYAWLVNDLSSTTKPWKVVIYHEPAYSAGSDGDNTAVRALEPLLTQYGVDLVYCGHSHNYARTGAYNANQAGGDQIALNIPHFTNGGGGAPIYQPDMTNTGNYPHVITAWPALEFMTFDVEGKNLTMTAYQVNGASISAIQPPSAMSLSPIETVKLHHYTNVTGQFTVTYGPLVQNGVTNLYDCKVHITNNGASLTGKTHLVLDGLLDINQIGNADNEYSTATPKLASKIAANPATGKTSPAGSGLITDLSLASGTDSLNGEPMVLVKQAGFANGQTITVNVTFNNPDQLTSVNFNPVLYQE